jgi:hypothetical protein
MRPPMISLRPLPLALCAVLALLLAVPALGQAEGPGQSEEPVPHQGEDAPSPSDDLTGRQIYQCVLDNRFDSYIQESRLMSGDRGADVQESRLLMTWASFRDDEDEAKKGVLSRTLVKYTAPFDLRFSGYLIVNNAERVNDQFVYLAATRRIRRVNLRREAIFGTDFTFEDVVPREIEDGDYERQPDTSLDGVPVYVVLVIPKDHADSEYSKFLIHVDKTTCIPALTRYWDKRDVEVKELTVPLDKVDQIEGIYWPMEFTMKSLQLETFTKLVVEEVTPNPEIRRRTFDLRALESH